MTKSMLIANYTNVVPMEVFEKGEKNKPIVRAVPIAILKPLIGLTSAANKIQQGFLNKYDDKRKE